MNKLHVEVGGVVMLPVRVTLDLLVRADDNANVETILKQFARGHLRTSKADIEDVEIRVATFQDDLDADETLAAHVEHFLDGGAKFAVVTSRVTDSR